MSDDTTREATPERAMIGVLILTHGGVAPELLASARVIAGELDNFHALALPWTDGSEEVQLKIRDLLPSIDRGQGVLILTDIFGGTPSNVAMGLRVPHRIEVIAGVNLPMVVRLGCLRKRSEMDVSELATFIRDKTKKSICCSSDLPGLARGALAGEKTQLSSSSVGTNSESRSGKAPKP